MPACPREWGRLREGVTEETPPTVRKSIMSVGFLSPIKTTVTVP